MNVRYILTKKMMSSLVLVTSIIFISQAEAVTTFGQEEDIFSRIWSPSSLESFKGTKLEKSINEKPEVLYLKKEPKELAPLPRKHPLDKGTAEIEKVFPDKRGEVLRP